MKFPLLLILICLATSCGNKVDDLSYQQLETNYNKARDTKKPMDHRILAYIYLKKKINYIELDESHEISKYIEKQETFFHKNLFIQMLKKIKIKEEDMLYLSSYDYQINETIVLKKKITVFTEKPKEANTIQEIEQASTLLKKSGFPLPQDTTFKVIDKLVIFKNSWLVIQTDDKKKYYCNSNSIKGISHLKNEMKAKAIWLADHYVKNFGDQNSLMYFTFLIEDFNLNINRKLTSNYQYLHKAVQRGTETKHFSNYLIKREADLNTITAFRQTPLDLAINNKAILYHTSKNTKTDEEKYDDLKRQVAKKKKLISFLESVGTKTFKELQPTKK